jgi:hypothetical protein
MYSAVRPGGCVILQVAHAAHADAGLIEDREAGPNGERDDVTLICRFTRTDGEASLLRAEYVYACKSASELLYEQHLLHVADANQVAQCARVAGFSELAIYDSWRRDPFHSSISPFVCGMKRGTAK